MQTTDANEIAIEPPRMGLAEWGIVIFMFLYAIAPLVLISTVTHLLTPGMWGVFGLSSACALYVLVRVFWGTCTRSCLVLLDTEVALCTSLLGFRWVYRRFRAEYVRAIEVHGLKRDTEGQWRSVLVRKRSGRTRVLLKERSHRHAVEHARRIAASIGVPLRVEAPNATAIPLTVEPGECCDIEAGDTRTVLVLRPDARSKRGSRLYIVLVVLFTGMLALVVWMFQHFPGFMMFMPILLGVMTCGLLCHAIRRWLAEPTRAWRITIDATTTVVENSSVFGASTRQFDTWCFAGARTPYLKKSAPKRPLGSVTLFVRGQRTFRFMSECDRETTVHAAGAINWAFHRHIA